MRATSIFGARLATAIQRIDYPIHQGQPNPFHGWYFIVGSVPAACYDHEQQKSRKYATLEECRKAIEYAGVDRYQLPDCSWNK